MTSKTMNYKPSIHEYGCEDNGKDCANEQLAEWEKFHERRIVEKMERGLRVMVGVDGSDSSRRALYEALALLNTEDSLTMVFYLDNVASQEQVHRAQEHLEHMTRLVSSVTKRLPSSHFTTKLVRGPSDVKAGLCRAVEELQPDILIVGNNGTGGLKGLMMGSVSTYLVSHASCPVLVAKELEAEKKMRKEHTNEMKGQAKEHEIQHKKEKKDRKEAKKEAKREAKKEAKQEAKQ